MNSGVGLSFQSASQGITGQSNDCDPVAPAQTHGGSSVLLFFFLLQVKEFPLSHINADKYVEFLYA